jgi:YesN/AraC family two-component response regulator
MIRVALVDDQAIVRAGLARILSPADGFEVVAECPDGRHAVEELPAVRPDVVLMDIRMPASTVWPRRSTFERWRSRWTCSC